jgi:hypothetical protein
MDSTYQVQQYIVKKGTLLHRYCESMTRLSNNLYNTVLFRIRQVFTGAGKDHPSENEQQVLDVLAEALPAINNKYGSHYKLPDDKNKLYPYLFWERLMRYEKNPEFLESGLPMQTAQYHR